MAGALTFVQRCQNVQCRSGAALGGMHSDWLCSLICVHVLPAVQHRSMQALVAWLLAVCSAVHVAAASSMHDAGMKSTCGLAQEEEEDIREEEE